MSQSLEHLLHDASMMRTKEEVAAAVRSPYRDIVSSAFQQFRDSLYRHVLMLTWNGSDAEELVQDGFLKLHQHLLEGKRIENIRAWLFRVVHNSAIDRGRTLRDFNSLSESTNARTAEEKLANRIPSPEAILLESERDLLLARAIDRLPELQRHCLFLRKEGLSYREIASVVSVGETTVIDNLARAIARLNREVHART